MYVTYILIGITVLFSIQALNNREIFYKTLFNPYQISRSEGREWYRFFTNGFVHADYVHLGVNMYSLYLFGLYAESGFIQEFGRPLGVTLYLVLYIAAIAMSSWPSYLKHKNDPGYNAVGASGAVAAIMLAAIIVRPDMELMLIMLPFFAIPGYVLALLYLIYSWYMARRRVDNIGHDAHFWGAVFGILFTAMINYGFIEDLIEYIRQQYGV